MNKKLISLAVAAALAAPAAAMAEATLYGKLNVSLDYVDVTNVVLPDYNTTNRIEIWGTAPNPLTGNLEPTQVARGTPGARLVAPGEVAVPGEDFTGWGMANGYIPNAVTYIFVPLNTAQRTALGLPGNLVVGSSGGGRANRVGVKGSEDLGGGLKAIYQVEFGINLTDTNNNLVNNADTISYRNTFVGLAGGWGTFLMGRHDTPLKISTGKLDLFADTLADMNATVGFQDLRADNAVAYISPSWSGFTIAGAVIPAGGSTALGVTNTESDQINGGWSLAGIYSNGPFYASAAYESLNSEMFNTMNTNDGCLPSTGFCANSSSDWNKWRLGLGLLDWNGFSLTAIYENQTGIAGSDGFQQYTTGGRNQFTWVIPLGPNKAELWQIQAGYAFGNSTVKAMYGQMGLSSDGLQVGADATALQQQYYNDVYNGDHTTWGIGYDYNFSKRTKAYALYTSVEDDRKDWVAGSEWDGFSLGMMHSF